MSILITVLLAVWMIVALMMILVILMQRPKSEGLGAAFGGGVTENIFGAQTTNVLVKFTGYLAAIFFVLTFLLSILYAKKGSGEGSALRQELMKTQAAAPQGSVAPGAPQPTGSAVTGATSPGANPMPSGSLPPAAAAARVIPPASVPVAPSAPPAQPTASVAASPRNP